MSQPISVGDRIAESALRQASVAITATGKDVKVDTAIVSGPPVTVLLAESRNAELVCVGSSGGGALSSRVVGSTATTVAQEAHCPVAIIREHRQRWRSDRRWIAVAVKACTDDEDIVIGAMREARLRHAPVVAVGLWQDDFGFTPYDELDRLMDSWRQRYPDIRVYPATARSRLAAFLNEDGDEPKGWWSSDPTRPAGSPRSCDRTATPSWDTRSAPNSSYAATTLLLTPAASGGS